MDDVTLLCKAARVNTRRGREGYTGRGGKHPQAARPQLILRQASLR